MKPIQEVVEALRDIPRALVPYEADPWQRPTLPGTVTEGSGSGQVVVDVSGQWDYPDWVEGETWDALDRDVFEYSDLPGARSGPAGIDALAWYVSCHYTGGGPWGIFIPVSSLGYGESRVFQGLRAPRARKWQLAYDALIAHEQMHFAVDYACAQWEVLLQAPSWAGLRDRRRVDGVPYLQVEEQLANAFMLQCAASWKTKLFERALRQFVAKQPAGYRDGLSVTDRDSFEHVAAEVVKTYIALHGERESYHRFGPRTHRPATLSSFRGVPTLAHRSRAFASWPTSFSVWCDPSAQIGVENAHSPGCCRCA